MVGQMNSEFESFKDRTYVPTVNIGGEWDSDYENYFIFKNLFSTSIRVLRCKDFKKRYLECLIWSVTSGSWNDRNCTRILDMNEYHQYRNIREPKSRIYYARNHAVVRCLLSRKLAIPTPSLIISRYQFGKPFLPNQPYLHFNLSHSGSYGGLAMANSPVGFDIEQPLENGPYEALAKRFFPFEADQLEASGSDESNLVRFARLWTAKEAYLKETGRGLTCNLNSFRLQLDASGQVHTLLSSDNVNVEHRIDFFSLPVRSLYNCVGTLVIRQNT